MRPNFRSQDHKGSKCMGFRTFADRDPISRSIRYVRSEKRPRGLQLYIKYNSLHMRSSVRYYAAHLALCAVLPCAKILDTAPKCTSPAWSKHRWNSWNALSCNRPLQFPVTITKRQWQFRAIASSHVHMQWRRKIPRLVNWDSVKLARLDTDDRSHRVTCG